MAIRLTTQRTDPDWHELDHGVAVYALPVTTPLLYAAQSMADAMLVTLTEAQDVVTRAGGHIAGTLDLDDPIAVAATRRHLLVVALAEIVVTDWRGVLADVDGPDGEPVALPFDPAHLSNLLLAPGLAEGFLSRCAGPIHEVVAEGNV